MQITEFLLGRYLYPTFLIFDYYTGQLFNLRIFCVMNTEVKKEDTVQSLII